MLGKVLEVGIGLAFIFLLLALVASALQELFATLVKLRGKYLVQGISNLLASNTDDCWKARNHLFTQKIEEFAGQTTDAAGRLNPKPSSWTGSALFLKVVGHPLFRDIAPKSMPSYVPARNFARALFDALKDDTYLGTELAELVEALPASPAAKTLAEIIGDPRATLDERLDRIEAAAAALPAGPEQERLAAFLARNAIKPQRAFNRIEAGIRALPPGSAKAALTTLAAGAAGDLKTFRADVETWFDDSMDRVGGVYKRFTQYFTIVFALAAAVLFNVNALEVASALWKNDALRESVVAVATDYMQACVESPERPECLRKEGGTTGDDPTEPDEPTDEGATPPAEPAPDTAASEEPTPAPAPSPQPEPAPATPLPAPAPSPAAETPAPSSVGGPVPPPATDSQQAINDKKKQFADTAEAVRGLLDPLSLPIGWDSTPLAACTSEDAEPPACNSGAWWSRLIASSLPGWLITAFAVMLGAPFWFDLLKLFLNIRGAGPKPKETPEATPSS